MLRKPTPLPELPRPFSSVKVDCVAIGVSTGGPTALYQIIPKLPKDFPAGIVIVQHMPPGFTKPLAERMDKHSNIQVKEAEMDDQVMPGVALVAPGGQHLFLERHADRTVAVRIDTEPSDLIHIPCIDLTFSDVADIYRHRTLGIILTGMGKDGVEGLQKIKACGGNSIAEDESTCVVFGMPEVAIQRGIIDRLEQKGFVERLRNSPDRRVITIQLTEYGKELAQNAPPPIQHKIVDGIKKLPEGEIRQIITSLSKLTQMLDVQDLEVE